MRRPRPLAAGDRVALVAPAGPPPAATLDAAVALLESWELRVSVAAHARDRHPRLEYLAGTDADRAADLRAAWLDPEIAAVFAVRGGYGTMRLLDLLDWSALAAAPPKLFVGSSDLTALHALIGQRLGLVSLFAPMVATDAVIADAEAREHLRRMVFEPERVTELAGPHARTVVPGRATGPLFGGTVSLLAATLGDRITGPPPPGAIVVLEDLDERPYRIDRCLTQLLRAGWFDDVAGIALGSWRDCGDPSELRAVLVDRLGPLEVPIVDDLGFGHCAGARTLPLGAVAELEADMATLRLVPATSSVDI